MAIEIKSPEDLGKVLGDLNTRVNEVDEKLAKFGDADQRHAELAKEVKAVQEQVNEVARKRVPVARENGKIPVSAAQLRAEGLKAVLQAQTPVRKGQFGYEAPDGPVAEFQEASDNLYLLAKTLKKEPHEVSELRYYREVYQPALARVRSELKDAFDTADSGGGSEWVGSLYSNRLWEKVRLEMRVAALFEQFVMPRSPFVFPVQLADLTPYTYAENTSHTGQTAITAWSGTPSVTGNITFTGKGLGTRAYTSKFLEEDSVVAMLPFLQTAVVQAIRNGIEDAIINGDTTATHRDNDIAAVALAAPKAWIGLRKAANTASSEIDAGGILINTTANFAKVLNARAGMGKYGVNPADLALIVSPVGFNQLLQVEAFSTAASLVGGSGTNVQGQFGFRPYGMELIVSEMVKDNLAATGVNTVGGPNTFSGMVIVNRRAWVLGVVRNITVQVLREVAAEYDQDVVLVTWRGDFEKPYGTSAKSEAFVYDIALS